MNAIPRTSPEVLHHALDQPATPAMRELGTFLSNDLSAVSNAFERWDAFPIFAFSSSLIAKLRHDGGRFGDTHRIEFEMNSVRCELDVTPAQVLDADRNQSVHYPGATEELVLEILYKLAAEEGHGFQSAGTVGVLFSYAMLRRHLAQYGHRRSHAEVVLAMEVLQGTRIVVHEKGDRGDKGRKEPLYLGAIIPQVFAARVQTNRSQETLYIAELPQPVSEAIESLSYRQCSYERVMGFKRPLAKWIYKRMVARWRQASLMENSYHFSIGSLEGSGWLQHSQARRRRVTAKEALDELVEREVLREYEIGHTYGGRAGRDIVDTVYTVHATRVFCTEQKAANGRVRDARSRMILGSSPSDSFALRARH